MKKELEGAKRLLENVTPLKTDCGLNCNAACCRDNGEAGACVWLLPGENEVEYEFGHIKPTLMPVADKMISGLYCDKPCDRSKRPFMCRIFPLSPYYSVKKGEWSVRMDRRAAPLCPLYGWGVKGLNPEFVAAAKQAVKLIAQTEDGEKLLKMLESEENAYRMEL